MADTDIVAWLYPEGKVDRAASKAIKASSRCVPLSTKNTKEPYVRSERESTEPPTDDSDSDSDDTPRVEVRFNDIPKDGQGVVVGSGPDCDVVVSHPKVSLKHFSLTFDEHNRLIVQDLGSRRGTRVTYQGQGEEWRSHFRWIVSGHEFLIDVKSIVISVNSSISFRLVVPSHNIASTDYKARVKRFCHGRKSAEEALQNLGLPTASHPETELPTGVHTPVTGAVYLRKPLAHGSFGSVTHVWDVSTGNEYALKEPIATSANNPHLLKQWKQEADIMKQITHRHIVALRHSDFEISPKLFLEYMPEGSLSALEVKVTYNETVKVLHQCLSALAYLHAQTPPIVHRDIKADNILVYSRSPTNIVVKLGDFGLSKDRSQLSTYCGTPSYIAPEILLYGQGQGPRYTSAVDVWSLGVVVYELLCGLPQHQPEFGFDRNLWFEAVIERFRQDRARYPDRLRQLLLEKMVVVSPTLRCSAAHCYVESSRLVPGEPGRVFTSNLASSTGGNENNSTIRGINTVINNPLTVPSGPGPSPSGPVPSLSRPGPSPSGPAPSSSGLSPYSAGLRPSSSGPRPSSSRLSPQSSRPGPYSPRPGPSSSESRTQSRIRSRSGASPSESYRSTSASHREPSPSVTRDNHYRAGHELTYTQQMFNDSFDPLAYGSSLASWYQGQGPKPESPESSRISSVRDDSQPRSAVLDEEELEVQAFIKTVGRVPVRK